MTHTLLLILMSFPVWADRSKQQSNFNRSRVSHSFNSAQISSGYDQGALVGNAYRGLMSLQYDFVKSPYKLIDQNGRPLSPVIGDFTRIRLGLGFHLNRTWFLGVSAPFDKVQSKPYVAGNQHPNILSDSLSQNYSGLGDIELSLRRRLEGLSLRWNWVFELLGTLPTGDLNSFNRDGDFAVGARWAFSRYFGRENQFRSYGYLGGRYAPNSKLEIDLYLPFESEIRLEFGFGVRHQWLKWSAWFAELGGFISFPYKEGQNPVELSLGVDFNLFKTWKFYAGYGLESVAGDKFSNDQRYYFGLKKQLGKLSKVSKEKFQKTPYPEYSSSYDALLDSIGSESSIVKKIVGKAKSTYFVTGSSRLSQEGELRILDIVSHLIKHKKHIKTVRIEGYADSRGSDAQNLSLSLSRAKAVEELLIEYGVSKETLEVFYYGEAKSILEADDFGKLNNRRTEIFIKEVSLNDIVFPNKEVHFDPQITKSYINRESASYIANDLFPKPFHLNGYLVEHFTILSEDNKTWGDISKRFYGTADFKTVLRKINYNRKPALGDLIYFPHAKKAQEEMLPDRFKFVKY